MSVKWERVKAWDDAFFPRWAWPVKAVLRALSSIWLAVVVLSGVVLYGTLASVPIGMLALIPTWAVYALAFVLGVGGATVLAVAGLSALVRPMPRAGRFVVLVLAGTLVAAGAAWGWAAVVWPHLAYHPAAAGHPATGFRLFGGFVDAYRSTTLRRLPGVEMTELEFYSAWPMRALLLVFVLNMVVATIRRIAFEFVNIGVLTVHTGIVLLALGAIYYSVNKREGDTLLQAGPADASGDPAPGPPVGFFYDNTQAVLVVDQWRGPEQRRLAGIPRYNDYNVGVAPGESVWGAFGRALPAAAPDGGDLDVPVEAWRGSAALVDPDIRFRMVGYASYATAQTDWVKADPALAAVGGANPLRLVTLEARLPETPDRATRVPFFFLPGMAAHRVAETPAFGIEYRIGAGVAAEGEAARADPVLEVPLPEAGLWGLYVRVPAAGVGAATGGGAAVEIGRAASAADGLVWTLEAGRVLEVAGYRLEVTEISPEPPFPIVTEGYRGATSPVALVRVTPPAGADGAEPPSYTRWVYARFPEINQDLLELPEEQQRAGMPGRRDADPAIDIRLIDASKLQVTIVESAPGGEAGAGRVVIRQRGGGTRALDLGDLSEAFEILPAVTLAVTDAWGHAVAFERPVPVEPGEQDRQAIGTHQKAMVAIEVTLATRPDFRRVVWLPFVQYLELGSEHSRVVELPDGRRVRLMFGRRQHRLPGMQVRLVDFQMLAYDHRGAPRDYQSIVAVEPVADGRGRMGFEAFTHVTKLNAPLTAPWAWREDRPWVENVAGRLAAGLDPDQYKFSQAGWDAEGWRESQAMVDAGLAERPAARFTILGVGNQPGIHVIALGGILMAVGTPWAFYVKPWLVRRRRDRLRELNTEPQRHRAGTGAEA